MAIPNRNIAIEGLPCAGKSTLGYRIRDTLGFSYVPEMADFLKKHERFPGDGSNRDEVYRIAEWFCEKEVQRYLLARSHLKKTSIVMDRSFVTILTYNYAYQKYTKITTHENLNRAVLDRVSRNEYLLPDLFIYLEITPEILRTRRKNRVYVPPASLPEFWLNGEFLTCLLHAYDKYFSDLNVPVVRINGALRPSEVYEQAVDFIMDRCNIGSHRVSPRRT